MFWWLNPISPCSDPSLTEPVKLPFSEGNYSGSDFKEGSKFIFGRKGDCSIRLRDQSISGHHCSMYYDTELGGLFLTDTSTNGTFLNGKRLTKSIPVQIKDGDEISLTRPKIMDDNITYHAVFRLELSAVTPGSTEEDAKLDTLDSTTIDKGKYDTNDLEIHMDSVTNIENNQREENILGHIKVDGKENDISNNCERRSLRSSVNSRSQDKKPRLSLREEEVGSKRNRGRPRTVERYVAELESNNIFSNDNSSIARIGSDIVNNDTEVGNGEETIRNNKFSKKNSVDAISQIDKTENNSSIENLSEIFEAEGKPRDSLINSSKVRCSNLGSVSQNYSSSIGENTTESEKRAKHAVSSRNSSDILMNKLENLEILVSRKESLERNLKSELEARDEEIARLRDILERTEVSERQLRQQNINLMEDLENVQKHSVDIENELIDFQERCRVLSASGEAMDQTISQLSEELSNVRQELLTVTEKYNRQSLALKSVTHLTQKKCLAILNSLKDIHQINSTYFPIGASALVSNACDSTGKSAYVGNSAVTPWRNTKRTLSSQYISAVVPQTERPYKMRYSPISSKGVNVCGDTNYMRRSLLYDNNYSSFCDTIETVSRSGLNNSGGQCSSGRFISGYLQLEEQLNSNIRPSSFEMQGLTSTGDKSSVTQGSAEEVEKAVTLQHDQVSDVERENPKLSASIAIERRSMKRSLCPTGSNNIESVDKENNIVNM